MGYLNTKLFMKNPTKSSLRKKGFRYDIQCGTKECDCYYIEFPVDYYKKSPVLICRLRIYMDNGEMDLDVVNCGDRNICSAWYQRNSRLYESHKDYIDKIDRNIEKELKKLHIKYRTYKIRR